MLTIILLFIRVFSINPILEMQYYCTDIGTDLTACQQEETNTCKFYEISSRKVWTIGTRLNVAIQTPDESSFSWYEGNVTKVYGDQLTVALSDCDRLIEEMQELEDGEEEESPEVSCAVTQNRYSFQYRDIEPTEFVGMRIEVWRTYFNRWITTNLTAIQDDEWTDLWAYGGEFGNMVGLQPFDVKAYDHQSCVLDPDQIPIKAEEIRLEANQVPEAVYCTEIYDEALCSDDFNLNCEWNTTLSACVLNQVTDDLIRCYAIRSPSDCVNDELHPGLKCNWLEGSHDDKRDGFCVNSSRALSIVFLTIFILLFM